LNEFADIEDGLFPIENEVDLLKKIPELVEKPRPFHHLLDLWDFWDYLSKSPSPTTIQCRAALKLDLAEMGISD
jgi:hypothetical protein